MIAVADYLDALPDALLVLVAVGIIAVARARVDAPCVGRWGR